MTPSLSLSQVLDQFRAAIRGAGLDFTAELVADGKLHRFDVEGDKRHSKNGWYVLHADGLPAGEYGCWKRQIKETWCAKADTELSADERAAHRARMDAMRAAREAEQTKTRKAAREKAAKLWQGASKRVKSDHPYLVKKQVRAYGLAQIKAQLVVPVRDAAGELHGLQFIGEDGVKKFLTGTDKRGHYHALGKPQGVIVIAEGYATGATIHAATGHAVAVAFDAGNLMPVAEVLRGKYPDESLVLAADNDHASEGNPGKTKAAEASARVAGIMVAPEFADGDKGTDWNDYAEAHGLDAVRAAFAAALQDAPMPTATVAPALQTKLPQQTAQASDAGSQGLRPSFEVRQDGVYFCDVEHRDGETRAKKPLFLCSPLVKEAVTRDTHGRGFGRLLSFTDLDGKPKTWLMDAALLGGSKGDQIRGALLSEGLPVISSEPNAQRKLIDYLMREAPATRARNVTATGWQGTAFVLPDHTYGGSSGERFFLNGCTDGASVYQQAGTLDGWRNNVSAPCGQHRYLVFALSCAFAGPLLQLTGGESGGFNLVSGSTGGKTTALRLAASTWGVPEIGGYAKSWRATDNGIEGVVQDHNDCLLALDDIGQANPAILGDVAYLLGNGTTKLRSNRDGHARAVKSFRVLLLSTGEIGTSTALDSVGKKSRTGQEVRMVEIVADAGRGLGMLDTKGDYADPMDLVNNLLSTAGKHYGHAGRAFLERITLKRDLVAHDARQAVRDFITHNCPSKCSPQVQRVAARLGLVAYAGQLATTYGLTGWRYDDVAPAMEQVFAAWLKARGTSGAKEPEQMVAQVRAFIEAHGGARFQDITKAKNAGADYAAKDDPDAKPYTASDPFTADHEHDTERRIIQRAGFRQMEVTGRTLYMVMPEVFRSEVCKGFDHSAVCRALITKSILTQQDSGTDRYTSRRRTPLSARPIPLYVLDGDKLLTGA